MDECCPISDLVASTPAVDQIKIDAQQAKNPNGFPVVLMRRYGNVCGEQHSGNERTHEDGNRSCREGRRFVDLWDVVVVQLQLLLRDDFEQFNGPVS